jgi:uncharacterized protein (TIGR02118 family)
VEKLFGLVRRPPGVDRASFCGQFLAAARGAAADAPQVERLVVDLVDVPPEEAGLRPGGEPSYDAVMEVWLEQGAAAGTSMPMELPGTTHVYRVEETTEREYERTWPVGERSPGVKSIYLARRRLDMTQADYAAYWGGTHAPLALKVHVGMWRYARNVVIEGAPGSDHWDGFAVLHFRTAQDLRERFYDSEEGRAAIAADVAEFTSGGRALHTSEYILKG